MEMKILKCEKKICPCCMEEHEVKTVQISEHSTFKDRNVSYEAEYQYCDIADEFYMNECQIQENDIHLKDSYRKAEGLLTSSEIIAIREKYDITQNDLCALLGWGAKTITRYESHQVQDRAHDTILKKLDRDPEWFLTLLSEARNSISAESFRKYKKNATILYEKNKDLYLRKAIEANYVKFQGNKSFQGNTELSLDKVVDMIRYFASSKKVTNLYKVKLMKMMWYADALSYRRRGVAITGLVYLAYPMGALPVAHNSIIELNGVPCEGTMVGESYAYHFSLANKTQFPFLSNDDIAILDMVIEKLGKMSKDEIVSFMHKEQAYMDTAFKDVIQFTGNLQI